jgi:hypothetical protein
VENICRDDTLKETDMFENLPAAQKFAIKMSGGCDSSLVAYLLAKHSIDNSLNLIVYPIIILQYDSPWQLDAVTDIINFIQSKTGFTFANTLTYVQNEGDKKIDIMRAFEAELTGDKTVDYVISGSNHIPKDANFSSASYTPQDRLGTFQELWDGNIYTPIMNNDKKDIADLYVQHNLMDTLFPITKSCVQDTSTAYAHCGNCWWCDERQWAFGKL